MPEHKCGDCGRKPGEYHIEGCDIERCPICKLQAFGCECAVAISTDEKYWIDKEDKRIERIKVKNSIDEDFGD